MTKNDKDRLYNHPVSGLEIFMEHTDRAGKAGTFSAARARIARGILLVVTTFLISRAPFMGECFPGAAALISYMVSRSAFNIYLVLPAAAAILPFGGRGYDIWGDLAAVCLCGLIFSSVRGVKLEMWQRALCAAAADVICVSMYRLISSTAYKISPWDLIFQGAVVFGAVMAFDRLQAALERKNEDGSGAEDNLSLISLGALCPVVIKGAGFDFLIWPFIIFAALWALTYGSQGKCLAVIVSSGAAAALLGNEQWGFLITLLIGGTAASLGRRYGRVVMTVIFAVSCAALGSAESGVILGVDNYCLLLGAAVFLAVNWKLSSSLRKLMWSLSENEGEKAYREKKAAEDALKESEKNVGALAELYGTYMDSRSVIATQLAVTEQIIEKARYKMRRFPAEKAREGEGKITMRIGCSQCAAAGSINGDCCGWQDIGDGRTAMIISDGMGKGKKAAAESLLVTRTVLSLLKEGAGVELILKMINEVMLMKENEDSFATVDLVIADRKAARAKFYKTGAAPTLIRRKSAVEEVRLSAVPLGIVNGLKIKYVEVSLKKGDWLIMMSDGVSDGGDGKGLSAVKETAAAVRSEDPKTMCDLIINRASDSYIGRERDDLTVLAAKIL